MYNVTNINMCKMLKIVLGLHIYMKEIQNCVRLTKATMLNRIKSLVNGKDPQQHTLLGESLEDLCKEATNSKISEVDTELISQIVDIINGKDAFSRQYNAQEVFQVLKKVLKQDNCQKQYLAVIVCGQILRECSQKMSYYEEDLLSAVAGIAARPSKKGPADMQRRARQEAMALLRGYAGRGQQALRAAAGLAHTTHNAQQTYTSSQAREEDNTNFRYHVQQHQNIDVLEEVHNLIQVATGHTELLEEMILEMTSNEQDNQFEMSLCTSLVSEIQELKQQFPRALESLSTLQTPEAETLMAAALESSDSLDNIRNMYESVILAQNQNQRNSKNTSPKLEKQSNNAQNGDNNVDATNIQDVPKISILNYPYKQDQSNNKQVVDNFPGFTTAQNQSTGMLPQNRFMQVNRSNHQQENKSSFQNMNSNSNEKKLDFDPFGLEQLQEGLQGIGEQSQNSFDPFSDQQNRSPAQYNPS